MWLPDQLRNNKPRLLGVLIFVGTLFVFFLLMNAEFLGKNIAVFFTRELSGVNPSNTLPQADSRPDWLSIPSLNIATPVVYISEKGESVYQDALARGVVHYPNTARPGEPGNVYIFGHSSDLPWSQGKYKTVFAPLTQIAVGDKIFLTDHNGQEFVYAVIETKVVAPNDLSVLSQQTGADKLLSLQTSYPLGTALRRFIVIARLVD